MRILLVLGLLGPLVSRVKVISGVSSFFFSFTFTFVFREKPDSHSTPPSYPSSRLFSDYLLQTPLSNLSIIRTRDMRVWDVSIWIKHNPKPSRINSTGQFRLLQSRHLKYKTKGRP